MPAPVPEPALRPRPPPLSGTIGSPRCASHRGDTGTGHFREQRPARRLAACAPAPNGPSRDGQGVRLLVRWMRAFRCRAGAGGAVGGRGDCVIRGGDVVVGASTDRIYIQRDDDWSRMRGQGLTTVVDPLVFRTGDVFLRGQKRITATDPEKTLKRFGKHSRRTSAPSPHSSICSSCNLRYRSSTMSRRSSLEHGELARTCRADRYVQPGRRTRADPSQRRS